jgi:uncharacterized protein YecT (DUF1311 family)
MVRGVLIAVILALFRVPAIADEADNVDCDHALTQFAMNACAGKDFEVADKTLSTLYARALAAQHDVPTATKFKAAESAWIKFRDAQCDHARATFEGGSMQSQAHLICLVKLTKARTRELEEYLACEHSDGVCE